MINPADYIKDNSLRIIVKPGKRQNYILGYDYDKKALIVEVKAPAYDNRANKEVIKFFLQAFEAACQDKERAYEQGEGIGYYLVPSHSGD